MAEQGRLRLAMGLRTLALFFSREDSISQKAAFQLCPGHRQRICSRFNSWVAGVMGVKFHNDNIGKLILVNANIGYCTK